MPPVIDDDASALVRRTEDGRHLVHDAEGGPQLVERRDVLRLEELACGGRLERYARAKPNALTLSPTQVDAFLERADVMSPAAYAALFRVTAGSGLRIDEARHLEDRDIDTSRRVLTVTPKKGWTTKGYRYRDVPISERTAAAGRTFIRLREKVALDDKSVWKEIHRVREGTTLPKFSMHDLRRAWASAMHANGATLRQISVWLGHADIATTEKYIRVFGGETTGHEFLPR